jgi:hypothetical protein
MVKFRLLLAPVKREAAKRYRSGNHAGLSKAAAIWPKRSIIKILIKSGRLEFDENSHRICVDFAQKRRFIANDSFKPVC